MAAEQAETPAGSVLCVGLATVDVVHRVPAFPGANSKLTATRQDVAAGGPATNAAVTAAALGSRVTLLTALGTHPLAHSVRDELTAFRISVRDATPDRVDAPGVSAVTVHEGTGERSVVSADARGVDPCPPAELTQLVSSADVLLIDGHHPRLALAAAQTAARLGVVVVLDAGRYKPHHEQLLDWVDVAVCSGDYRLPNCEQEERTIRALAERVAVGAMTRGHDPIVWWRDELRGEVPVPVVSVQDTLGAGDVFHGAFAHAVAAGAWDGGKVADHLAFATRVASVRVQSAGPRTWLDKLPSVVELGPVRTL
ncbi:PfkB family carbohydrate kinase [Allokutzneria multivorans]|uniref:PfkB family carbohydrate kinase n=1 Tax=Allokutzneria multivorans TaxID=1142134 RepID=A0ABP7RLW3_9PSEU